ncbi:MAG: hypothetical protein IJB71_04535 [Bacilli bacterium]|nr:hypothetical protein [Bacilli bacterium]
MKKFLVLVFMFLLMGCEINLTNTPTKQVEKFLINYQTLNKKVVNKLENEIKEDVSLTNDQQEKYLDFWKKHYQGLNYTIKDQTENGDEAIVIAEIEVNDYSKIISESSAYLSNNPEEFVDIYGEYDLTKFNDYKLEQLLKAKERVTYTLEFKVKKENKKWKLENLSEEDYSKLSGMYNY